MIVRLDIDPTRRLPLPGTVTASTGRMLMRPHADRVDTDVPPNSTGSVSSNTASARDV